MAQVAAILRRRHSQSGAQQRALHGVGLLSTRAAVVFARCGRQQAPTSHAAGKRCWHLLTHARLIMCVSRQTLGRM